jgi:hypothetical protein
VYRIFPPYSPLYPLPSHWSPPHTQDLFCIPTLGFCKKKMTFCLRSLCKVFHCDISIYICIIT